MSAVVSHPVSARAGVGEFRPYAVKPTAGEIAEHLVQDRFLVDDTVAQVRTSEFVLCIEEKVNAQLQEKLEIKMKSDLRLREIEDRLKEIFEERDRLMEQSKKETINGI